MTLLCAGLLSLVSAPVNLHWLHWLLFVPFFWVLREGHNRANAAYGWLFGTVGVMFLFSWVADTIILFSNIPWPVAWLALFLFAGVWFTWPYVALWAAVHPLRQRLGSGWILALPALQVVIEYLSTYLLLFPYNQGVGQYRNPFVWQIASITGVWGASWLVMLVNCAFAEAIYRKREGRAAPIPWMAGAVSALSLVVIYGAWRFEQVEAALREAPVMRVGQLQTERTMVERLQTRRADEWTYWIDKTFDIPPGTVDLVVWPEGASPYSLQAKAGEKRTKPVDMVTALAKRGGFDLIVGGGARERVPGTGEETSMVAFNSVYHVSPEGEVTNRYDKMVPLPFGEYMPLADTPFAFLVDWIQGPGNFQAGEQAVILEGGGVRFATPICYEAILSTVCRSFERPDVFVTVTNDAWFGDTASPHQHAMLAAVRATELGVPMVRSAYTGVSFVVEPHGVIHSETVPFTEVQRIVGVRLEQFPTFYARWGDWFVGLCGGGLLIALLVAPWRARPG